MTVYEGKIVSIDPETRTFVAWLKSEKDTTVTEEIEISFDEVPEEDREFIRNGALFYWPVLGPRIHYLVKFRKEYGPPCPPASEEAKARANRLRPETRDE